MPSRSEKGLFTELDQFLHAHGETNKPFGDFGTQLTVKVLMAISVISILKKNSISILIPFFPNFISISNFHFTENSYFNSNSIL